MKITEFQHEDFPRLKPLLQAYKHSINEEPLNETQLSDLVRAIKEGRIIFFTASSNQELIAMCSITIGFSTFNCKNVGIFEDFYITPDYRGKGVARELTTYVFSAMEKYDVQTVWVGCADMDLEMYKHLGFNIPLGNLLAWSKA